MPIKKVNQEAIAKAIKAIFGEDQEVSSKKNHQEQVVSMTFNSKKALTKADLKLLIEVPEGLSIYRSGTGMTINFTHNP